MEEKKSESGHIFTLEQRNHGMVTGVQDVRSFDETEILLLTTAGKIMIKGERLHVRQLNLEEGEVELEGRVDSIVYMAKGTEKNGQSVLKRMFR